jgi:hypothetical protein
MYFAFVENHTPRLAAKVPNLHSQCTDGAHQRPIAHARLPPLICLRKLAALPQKPFPSPFTLQRRDTKRTPRATHVQPQSGIRFGNEVSFHPTLAIMLMFRPLWRRSARACVSPHDDQPIDGPFCIAGYSFKMIAFDFSSFAQHRDDRGSAKCERPGARPSTVPLKIFFKHEQTVRLSLIYMTATTQPSSRQEERQ